jgi:hypothetical protein
LNAHRYEMFVELDNSRYLCRLNVLRKVPLAPLLMDECSISNGPGAPAKFFLIILWGNQLSAGCSPDLLTYTSSQGGSSTGPDNNSVSE